MEFIEFISKYSSALATLISAAAIIYIYLLGKIQERKSAATMVILNIRQVENFVESILKKQPIKVGQHEILKENNWHLNKHHLINKLTTDDLLILDDFFNAADIIRFSLKRHAEIYDASLNEKAKIYQRLLFEGNKKDEEESKKTMEHLEKNDKISRIFHADDPLISITEEIQTMPRITSTSTFDRLKKIAAIK